MLLKYIQRDTTKTISGQWTVIPTQPVIFIYDLHNMITSLTNKSMGKSWSEDSLQSWQSLKSLKWTAETLTVSHDLLQIPENPFF